MRDVKRCGFSEHAGLALSGADDLDVADSGHRHVLRTYPAV